MLHRKYLVITKKEFISNEKRLGGSMENSRRKIDRGKRLLDINYIEI